MSSFPMILLPLGIILFPGIAATLILRFWLGSAWERIWLRALLWLLPSIALLAFTLILLAPELGLKYVRTPLGPVLLMALLPSYALMGALLISAMLRWIAGWKSGSGQGEALSGEGQGRRLFLQRSAQAIPVLAAAGSLGGIASTLPGARVFSMPLEFPDLPEAFHGVKIFHLTDLHLGGYLHLDYLQRTLDRARPFQPDLVVLTGDISDDVSLLPRVLEMVAELKPSLGVCSVFGNHEYGNGIRQARAAYQATRQARLLVNEGILLRRGDSSIFLAGVDDILGKPPILSIREYIVASVDMALEQRDQADFRILLSHRPAVFDAAAMNQVQLTLAGHTHGGQLACCGHSWLELTETFKYPWGLYRKGDSLLYTSAGAGQWIPFRLGCPAEAPVYELRRSG